MGYYIDYKLEIIDNGNNYDHLIKEFINEYDLNYVIDENGETYQSAKWYEHEDHLKEFSKKHQNILFKLIGEGEESGDIWIKYFKDGKIQVCKAKIVIPGFDEKLLK